jgi:tetratricopeptide (TPR) repeat protein
LVAERALLEAARGHATAAHELAATELQALRKQLHRRQLPDAEARLLLACGLALQAQGELQHAETDLREALALRRQHDDEASLWLAQVQIALAECLVASGRREEACALLDEAKHIHSQHPPLGPHLASALEVALRSVDKS